jgi:hypothetical protein
MKRLTLCLVTMTMAACAKHNATQSSNLLNQTPAPRVQKPPQVSRCSQCTAAYQNRGALPEEATQEINIERVYQRVIRKDCGGRTVSDRIETVRSPRQSVVLKPANLDEAVAAVDLFNPLTCNSIGSILPVADLPFFGLLYEITGETDGTVNLKADLADAWLTFQLQKGLNKVYYTYYKDCLPNNPLRNLGVGTLCPTATEVTSGIFVLDVKYSERTLDDTLTIASSSCH